MPHLVATYSYYIRGDRLTTRGKSIKKDWVNVCMSQKLKLKVTYHPLYSMTKFVTNKSKLPQDGTQVFPYMG